jgi:hypothetical protein
MNPINSERVRRLVADESDVGRERSFVTETNDLQGSRRCTFRECTRCVTRSIRTHKPQTLRSLFGCESVSCPHRLCVNARARARAGEKKVKESCDSSGGAAPGGGRIASLVKQDARNEISREAEIRREREQCFGYKLLVSMEDREDDAAVLRLAPPVDAEGAAILFVGSPAGIAPPLTEGSAAADPADRCR